MDKIKWCASRKDGLELIEPNPDLSQAYLKKSEEALESMRINTVRDWKISTAYYSSYFALYSLLMRVGVKCEIHACTINFAKTFLKEYFSDEDIEFLEESLKSRIDAQYYVDRSVPDAQFEKMMNLAPEFLVRCKSFHAKLNEGVVRDIRAAFKKAAK